MNIAILMALALTAGPTGLLAQSKDAVCGLSTHTDGQIVVISGRVQQTAHDMLLQVPNCPDPVVLTYASDPTVKDEAAGHYPIEDGNLSRFRKYTAVTYTSTENNICMGCYKYEVQATLTGRLDLAKPPPAGSHKDQLGFFRDQSGKVVGVAGFGNPAPVYKYRLVIQSVSRVVAEKRPRTLQETSCQQSP
jgi:hypothetical protein